METTRKIAALATLRQGPKIKREWIVPFDGYIHRKDKWILAKEYHEWDAESELTYIILGGINAKIIERYDYLTLIEVDVRSIIHHTFFIGQDARVR